MNYIWRQWITNPAFPKKNWSVFMISVGTYNDLKGWHNSLPQTTCEPARGSVILPSINRTIQGSREHFRVGKTSFKGKNRTSTPEDGIGNEFKTLPEVGGIQRWRTLSYLTPTLLCILLLTCCKWNLLMRCVLLFVLILKQITCSACYVTVKISQNMFLY